MFLDDIKRINQHITCIRLSAGEHEDILKQKSYLKLFAFFPRIDFRLMKISFRNKKLSILSAS